MIPALVVALVTIFFFSGSSISGLAGDGVVGPSVRTGQTPDLSETMLVFFNVKNGKVRRFIYTSAELSKTSEITVDGYVAGIVALSRGEFDIYKDKNQMQKVSWQKDGTLFLNHFGKLNPKKMLFSDSAEPDGTTGPAVHKFRETNSVRGYSLFPKITGDAVSPENRFTIDILKNGKQTKLAIHQGGYRGLLPDPLRTANGMRRFRYIGDRMKSLASHIHDFNERIRSITEGIDEVEEIFQVRLVRNVNIVDYTGMQNALTSVGHHDIWVFIDIFQNETISELKTIAGHEALHLLVDRYNFTKSTAVRELFAELKGYGDLSLERFFIVTQGRVIPDNSKTGNPHHFFDFINEKNFFIGRNGGHSQDNLDEFCTSFLHTLMFPAMIEQHLNQQILSDGKSSVSPELQCEIQGYYREMIGSLLASLGRSNDEPIKKMLETNL